MKPFLSLVKEMAHCNGLRLRNKTPDYPKDFDSIAKRLDDEARFTLVDGEEEERYELCQEIPSLQSLDSYLGRIFDGDLQGAYFEERN